MPLANYNDQIIVNDIKFHGKTQKLRSGKTQVKGAWFVDAEIPGIKGSLNAGTLGKVFAGEVIDNLRKAWTHGKDADLRPHKIKNKTKDWRKYRADVVHNVSSDDEMDRRVSRKENTKYRKWIKKQYSYRGRAYAGQIDGFETHGKKGQFYVPNPNHGALFDSGIMIDSLNGRYIREANYINKKGKHIVSRSSVIIRVAQSRQEAAFIHGGMRNASRILSTRSGALRGNYKNTMNRIDNAIYINDRKHRQAWIMASVRTLGTIARFFAS